MAPKILRAQSSIADEELGETGARGSADDLCSSSMDSSASVTGLAFCVRLIEVIFVDPIVHRLMRWSISPLGLLFCYRLPLLLHLPLDLLSLYCPFADYCGFGGSLVDYQLAGIVSAAALLLTYGFVWREASRFWRPRVMRWLMRSLLIPVAKTIKACLETRQLPNTNRAVDFEENQTLLKAASALYVLVSIPFIPLTDVFIFVRWPAVAVQWNFASDYERCRSISFALFSAPIQLGVQAYLVAKVGGSATLIGALTVTIVSLLFNVVNAKHQSDTVGNFAGFFRNMNRLVSMKIRDKSDPPFPRVLRSRTHMDYSAAGAFTAQQAGGLAQFMLTNKTLESLVISEENKIPVDAALGLGRAILAERQNNPSSSVFQTFNDMSVASLTGDQAVYLTPDTVRAPLFVMGRAALKIKLSEVSCLEGIPWLAKPRTDAKRLELFEASGLVVLSLLQFNSNLVDLDLGSNKLTDACAPALGQVLRCCEALTNLDISLNPQLTVTGMKTLTDDIVGHRSLKTIRIATVQLDLAAIKTGKHVDFSAVTVYKDSVKRILERITNLAKEHKLLAKELGYPPVEDFRGIIQRIVARNYRVTRDLFRSFPETVQTWVFDRALVQLGHPYATDPGDKLDANNPQRSGQLSTSVVTPIVAVVLAAALRSNAVVETIDLRGAMIGTEGVDAIFATLTSCPTIQSVDLAYNDLSGAQVADRTIDLYAEMVAKNEGIKLLTLTGNSGFTNHAERLQRLASAHPKLKLKLR